MKKLFCIPLLLMLFACDGGVSLSLNPDSGQVNFSESIEGDWEQLCIFEPYSDNDKAAELLGFAWDLESNSGIYSLDSITLLVFASTASVVQFEEVTRDVDFSPLGGKCYDRSAARFNIEKGAVTLAQ